MIGSEVSKDFMYMMQEVLKWPNSEKVKIPNRISHHNNHWLDSTCSLFKQTSQGG